MEHLAKIVYIDEIKPHENADTLELATVGGWQVVVKKGEFDTVKPVIFCEIDTVFKGEPEFASFLEPRKWRVRTVKLRGELSQGLILPLSVLPNPEEFALWLGADVSSAIGLEKYESPDNAQNQGVSRSTFPSYVGWFKADEENIKSCKFALEKLRGRPYYITEKADGTSASYTVDVKDDGTKDFLVCSRNQVKVTGNDDVFNKAAVKYNLEEKLSTEVGIIYGIQCEVVGPGIQKNRMGLTDIELRIFNAFDKRTGLYCDWDEVSALAFHLQVPTVKIIEFGDSFDYSLEELQAKADVLRYSNGGLAEGMVVRPVFGYQDCFKRTLSFKVMNDNYLLKNEDK